MIKPKYEIGYRFKVNETTFEVIERNYTNSTIIYYAINLSTGFVNCYLEFEIDKLVGGKNAKKPRKK